MPRYLVRLEQGEHHRTHELEADSEAAARLYAQNDEQRLVAFTLDGDELAAAEAEEQRRGRPRFELVAHRQTEPYDVVDVQEIGEAS